MNFDLLAEEGMLEKHFLRIINVDDFLLHQIIVVYWKIYFRRPFSIRNVNDTVYVWFEGLILLSWWKRRKST